jgi:hypothetical protein
MLGHSLSQLTCGGIELPMTLRSHAHPATPGAASRRPTRARLLRPLLAAAAVLVWAGGNAAPAAGQTGADPDPLRVFLDCHAAGCDSNHLQREILFVAWVRDTRDADVHVLATSRTTGGGGRELEFRFLGAKRRAGADFQLRRISGRDDTLEEIRGTVTRTIALGLAALAVGTAAAERLELAAASDSRPIPPGRIPAEGAERDPWRAWVFRVGATGSMDGERSVASSSFSAYLSARHTTDTWKFQLRADGSHFVSRFELSDSVTLVSRREGYGLNTLLVRSLGDRVSTGIRAAGTNSTYLNQKVRVQVAPAVEYSVFPYSASTTRQILVRYSPGVSHYRFTQETIYGVLEETLGEHALTGTLNVLQPWGSAKVELAGTMLMMDVAQNRLDLTAELSWRVVRGLSFDVFGVASHVANQRSLPRGGATDEEILLRRRELATSFRYMVTVGLGYTFGSRFAGPVNPRLGG